LELNSNLELCVVGIRAGILRRREARGRQESCAAGGILAIFLATIAPRRLDGLHPIGVTVSQTSAATVEAAEVTPEFVRSRVAKLRVVEVLDHGEVLGGFLSREELEHYRTLVSREIEVFKAGEFPDDVVAALEESHGKYGQGVG
jgi:hypothetical protein